MLIEDGTGSGYTARVDSDNRLRVSARSDESIHFSSEDGLAYIWHSVDAAAAAGEYTLYLQNTSTTQNLAIQEVVLSPGVDMTFKIATVTGTAAGTPITGFNMNQNSGNAASANAFGNAAVTGLTEATLFITEQVLALTTAKVDFHDALILGQNDNIAIECDVNAGGTVSIMVIGHFE